MCKDIYWSIVHPGGESSKKEGKKKREIKDMKRGTERKKEGKKQNPGKTWISVNMKMCNNM